MWKDPNPLKWDDLVSNSLIVYMHTHTFILSTYTNIEYLYICACVYQ